MVDATPHMDLRAWLAPWGVSAPALCLRHLCSHSAAVQPGDAFLMMAGARLAHAQQAVAQGARCIIIPEGRSLSTDLAHALSSVPCLSVMATAGQLASGFYGHPTESMTVVAVTGTNGKTSCTQFQAQLLHALGMSCGVVGTLGVGLDGVYQETGCTTPNVVDMHRHCAEFLQQGARYCVCEASSHGLLQQRLQSMALNVGVLTNVTQDHLDYHGDMSAYQAAKARLFEFPLALRVLNLDDAVGRDWAGHSYAGDTLTYAWQAQHRHAHIWADQVQLSAAGTEAHLHTPWGEFDYQSPLLGVYNVSNILAVLATLGGLGMDMSALIAACATLQPVPGRLQPVTVGASGESPQVMVDYAHTPDALRQVLRSLRALSAAKIWCVFGCGGDRDQGKRVLMARVAEQYSDYVVVTSDNPRLEDPQAIIQQIRSGFHRPDSVCYIEDRAAAIHEAIQQAGPCDMVLIAGKGHESYQIIGEDRMQFSDIAQAEAALACRSASPCN